MIQNHGIGGKIMQLEEVRTRIRKTVEQYADEIIGAGEYIWKNPEPGYREWKTSEFLITKFRELGFQVKTGLAMTGFRADLDTGRPGPTIAVLGEIDSLILPNHPQCDPATGAVHACGHHTCAAAMLGTAIALVKSGVLDSLSGKIAFIACPAEEGIEMDYRKELIKAGKIKSISGKSQLIREGVFDDIDIAFLQHISSHFGYNNHNGAINKQITFRGKSCHAAGPQHGKNALNAMTLALNAIAMLRESYSNESFVRIHGIVTRGGDAVNIIPDTISMDYMLRAMEVEKLLRLNQRFDNAVMYAAKAAECEAEITTLNGYMPLKNDRDLGELLKQSFHWISPETEFRDTGPDSAGSTDAGDIGLVVPMIHGNVSGMGGTLHGIDFSIADPENAYIRQTMLNAVFAVDLLYGSAELGKAVAEKKKDLMPTAEYIKMIDGINQTVSSEDL